MRFRFHFWNTALTVFFAVVAVCGYWWLAATNHLVAWLSLSDFFLMALATMRLVRLFTYDAITGFVRDWFAGADPDSFRGALNTLINCPWCIGLWFALIVVFFYYATPISWYAIIVLALAAAASLLQVLAQWITWSAEAKKREAQLPTNISH